MPSPIRPGTAVRGSSTGRPIMAADQLHNSAQISDDLWERLAEVFDEAQCLDIFMMCGWYHAISFAANGARIPLEEGTPTFASVLSS